MRLKLITVVITSLLLISYSSKVNASSSIDIYRSFIEGFPSVQSFSLQSQALNFDNQNIGKTRFLNPTLTTLYSNYQTQMGGVFSITDFSIANTIDIFNKLGIDKAKNKLEIKRNYLLTRSEKRDIYTRTLDAYTSAVKNKYLMKIHKENLDWLEQKIILVKKAIDKGQLPETELNRWNVERLNQINLTESDKLEILRAEETLKLHTGFDKIITDDIDSNRLKNNIRSDINELDFVKNSPEIETLSIDQEQLKLDIKRENKNLLPDLQVSDTFEINGDPTSNGNQNIVFAALNFKLPNGERGSRIKSAQNKIQGIEYNKKTQIILLQNTFRNKLREIDTQKIILDNLENSINLSNDTIDKLMKGDKKRYIDYFTLIDAVKSRQTLQENYINTLANFDYNYEYLYHLSKGDIY